MRGGRGQGLQLGRGLLVLCGLWLASSPWMFGYAVYDHAVQDTITGILLVSTAVASALLGAATGWLLWVALVLGVWTMATPVMFGQAGRSFSANNDIVLGMLILLSAAIALSSHARMRLFAGGPDPQGAADQTSLW